MGLIKPVKLPDIAVPEYFGTPMIYDLDIGKHILNMDGSILGENGVFKMQNEFSREVGIFMEPVIIEEWEAAGKLDGLETFKVLNFRIKKDVYISAEQNLQVDLPLRLYHETTNYNCPDGVIRHKIAEIVLIPDDPSYEIAITGAEMIVMIPRRYA